MFSPFVNIIQLNHVFSNTSHILIRLWFSATKYLITYLGLSLAAIFHHHHHHHHVVLLAWISLTLFGHQSLSSITFGRSSRLHPVSAQSCRCVIAGRPTLARPCEEVQRSTLLMCSPLLLQQCPACLVRLIWMAFVMGGWWSYSCCFVWVLPPGLVQYSSKHSLVIAVKLFLHTLS